jgi:L-aminopeptidase/D-esterase-like protein
MMVRSTYRANAKAAVCLLACLILSASEPARAQQTGLTPTLAHASRELHFDWPAVEISSATYETGPTGVTLFHFPHRVTAVVDVRGGGPGTVNTDSLRLGYMRQDVDSVVFAGGSLLG